MNNQKKMFEITGEACRPPPLDPPAFGPDGLNRASHPKHSFKGKGKNN